MAEYGSEETRDDSEEAEQAPALNVKKLKKAVERSYEKLSTFREQRLILLKDAVGHHYGDGAAEREMPVNQLAIALQIYSRALVPQRPRVLMTTEYDELKPVAANNEIALNRLFETIDLKGQLEMAVSNALIGMGIVKIGLRSKDTISMDGEQLPLGEPYAANVDFDDWFHDTCARTWDEIAFCGNRYKVRLKEAQNNPGYDPEMRELLRACDEPTKKDDKAADISHEGKGYDDEEYTEYIELQDIWLPYERKLVTIPVKQELERPLSEIDWIGPASGPYRLLSYIRVPNNVMPVAPASHWYDLNRLMNSVMRKLGRQADREKHLTLVAMGSTDAETLRTAKDGELVSVVNPKDYTDVKFGGADQGSVAFHAVIKSEINWLMGNLSALGGLEAQSETFKQDQLITQNASKQVQEMQVKTLDFARDVIRDLAWWHWTDPLRVDRIAKPIPGMEDSIITEITPQDREQADFLAYNIDVDPYSLQDNTPQARLQGLMNYLNGVLMPMSQMFMEQGMAPDAEAIARTIARYSNMPELVGLTRFQRPPEPTADPQPKEPPKPAHTTREYVHRSMPMRTSAQRNNGMIKQMMTGQLQQSEKDVLAP